MFVALDVNRRTLTSSFRFYLFGSVNKSKGFWTLVEAFGLADDAERS